MKKYRSLKRLHDTGLPKNYWNADKVEFAGDKDALAKVRDYIKNLDYNLANGIGLYLHGERGVGKTMLSALIVLACLRLGKPVKFYYFTDALTTFTDAWKDVTARNELEHAILESDFLVLDDLGREYHSNKDLHESVLDTMIRVRANQLRPVVVTSNYDIYDIKERYGKGVIDLFKESLVCVKVPGDSYRRQRMDDKMRGVDDGSV